METDKKLMQVAEGLKAGQVPAAVSVRLLLSWFDVRRRGSAINPWVREALDAKPPARLVRCR